MEKEKEIGFVRSGGKPVLVKTGWFRGYFGVDVRRYYEDEDATDYSEVYEKLLRNEEVRGVLKPTKKGIFLRRDQFTELMRESLIPLFEELTKVEG